jgi:hypothetical protein
MEVMAVMEVHIVLSITSAFHTALTHKPPSDTTTPCSRKGEPRLAPAGQVPRSLVLCAGQSTGDTQRGAAVAAEEGRAAIPPRAVLASWRGTVAVAAHNGSTARRQRKWPSVMRVRPLVWHAGR